LACQPAPVRHPRAALRPEADGTSSRPFHCCLRLSCVANAWVLRMSRPCPPSIDSAATGTAEASLRPSRQERSMTIAAAPAREASKAYRTELSPVSFLRRSASIYKDKVAVVQGDRRISSVPLQWLVLHLGGDRGGCPCTLLPAVPPDDQALTPGASPASSWGRTRPEPPRSKHGQETFAKGGDGHAHEKDCG